MCVLMIFSWRVTEENIFLVISSSGILFEICVCRHDAWRPPNQSFFRGPCVKLRTASWWKSSGFRAAAVLLRRSRLSMVTSPNPPESKTDHILGSFAGLSLVVYAQSSRDGLRLRLRPGKDEDVTC